MKRPYGYLSFYAPMLVGVTVNWVLFAFIFKVIIQVSTNAVKYQAKSKMSSMKIVAVSLFHSFPSIIHTNAVGQLSVVASYDRPSCRYLQQTLNLQQQINNKISV